MRDFDAMNRRFVLRFPQAQGMAAAVNGAVFDLEKACFLSQLNAKVTPQDLEQFKRNAEKDEPALKRLDETLGINDADI